MSSQSLKSATALPQTNVLAGFAVTLDLAKAAVMRDALDAGDMSRAKMLARELMDSKEQKVRLLVIDAMEWIGMGMVPDLAELMRHEDEVTAEAALQAWDRILATVQDEKLRIDLIMKSARGLERENLIDAVLMHLVDCDRVAAISALSDFIETTKGTVANACAKEIFAHVACEPWESPLRAKLLIKEMKG